MAKLPSDLSVKVKVEPDNSKPSHHKATACFVKDDGSNEKCFTHSGGRRATAVRRALQGLGRGLTAREKKE